jgi:NAD(P)-dependent dehydrogenase (short-subunit alcohol dehydrogenase family)
MTPALNALYYLKGKVALVTGASTSIGRGVAPRLSEADASIAVNYRGDRKMQRPSSRAFSSAP